MRTLLLLACAAIPASALLAQNVTGTWQGSLQGPQGPALRIVMKISLEDDKLKAVSYSIDQGAAPIPVSAITRDGSSLKITLAAIGGGWEGKVSADGNSMTGTWTQGGGSSPLNFTKATPETAWTIPEPPPPPTPMAVNADPTFAVATIKPSEPGRPGRLYTRRGQDLLTINTSLNDLIIFAYDLHPKQVVGTPSWADSDKYDITGRPDKPGQASNAQFKLMIQKLLADRFQLKFHREKKELAAYTITVLKSGAKLKASTPESTFRMLFGPGGPGGGVSFNVGQATLTDVAGVLQGAVLDKPVVNESGLTGKYDFVLKFTPDSGQMTGLGPPPAPPAGVAADPDAPPDIFTAFQQQLGLKLESTKAQVDVLLIDKVEKPSEN